MNTDFMSSTMAFKFISADFDQCTILFILKTCQKYALYKWKFIWLLNTLLRVQQGEQPLGRGLADMRNDLYDWDFSCNAMQWSGKRNDILTHITGDSVMQISIIVMFMWQKILV